MSAALAGETSKGSSARINCSSSKNHHAVDPAHVARGKDGLDGARLSSCWYW